MLSCDFVGYKPHRLLSHHPAKYYVHRHCGSGNSMVLVCQQILRDHLTRGSSNFMAKVPQSKLPTTHIWWS